MRAFLYKSSLTGSILNMRSFKVRGQYAFKVIYMSDYKNWPVDSEQIVLEPAMNSWSRISKRYPKKYKEFLTLYNVLVIYKREYAELSLREFIERLGWETENLESSPEFRCSKFI